MYGNCAHRARVFLTGTGAPRRSLAIVPALGKRSGKRPSTLLIESSVESELGRFLTTPARFVGLDINTNSTGVVVLDENSKAHLASTINTSSISNVLDIGHAIGTSVHRIIGQHCGHRSRVASSSEIRRAHTLALEAEDTVHAAEDGERPAVAAEHSARGGDGAKELAARYVRDRMAKHGDVYEWRVGRTGKLKEECYDMSDAYLCASYVRALVLAGNGVGLQPGSNDKLKPDHSEVLEEFMALYAKENGQVLRKVAADDGGIELVKAKAMTVGELMGKDTVRCAWKTYCTDKVMERAIVAAVRLLQL